MRKHALYQSQEEGVRITPVTLAVAAPSICGGAVVLASATLQLEKLGQCRGWEILRGSKLTFTLCPAVIAGRWRDLICAAKLCGATNGCAQSLRAEVDKRLSVASRAMLLSTVAGYAPVTLCRACGHQIGGGPLRLHVMVNTDISNARFATNAAKGKPHARGLPVVRSWKASWPQLVGVSGLRRGRSAWQRRGSRTPEFGLCTDRPAR